MFDELVTSAIERMIRHLTAECHATHRKMIGPDLVPVISPMSEEWRMLSARHAELGKTIEAAYAELIRREQEAADARALVNDLRVRMAGEDV